MDVSRLLADSAPSSNESSTQSKPPHHYPTRQGLLASNSTQSAMSLENDRGRSTTQRPSSSAQTYHASPPKLVSFQLLLSDFQHRARLPLRVHIQPHDTTDSIITTVKNFYGLYEGQGVSFEDSTGVTLIARYDNLDHNGTVHVRVMQEIPSASLAASPIRRGSLALSPHRPRLDEPFSMLPPSAGSRPSSRNARKRETSPPQHLLDGRADPVRTASRPRLKSSNSFRALVDDDADSDAGSVSVTSSRRAKMDAIASADISMDNIVEGGRRKRAKFESSELPLFAPPQVPVTASISSLSPQRRDASGSSKNVALPASNGYTFAYNNNNNHNNNINNPLPSPQSFAPSDSGMAYYHNHANANQQYNSRLRARGSGNFAAPRLSGGSNHGALPTPDPTIGGSVMSDEDVALQLMRLGDLSNFSSHGRNSASTLDDALSGKADAASSVEHSEDENAMSPGGHHFVKKDHVARKKQKGNDGSVRQYDDDQYTSASEYDFDGSSPDGHGKDAKKGKKPRQDSASSRSKPRQLSGGKTKIRMQSVAAKTPSAIMIPPPYSLDGPGSRTTSISSAVNIQTQLGIDDEDLSSKPRCQRCRKSKKGCDRQRPCGRCKDAGIGIEGCVSEDEGNGRKGRYGRHMGVPLNIGASEHGDSVAGSTAGSPTTVQTVNYFHAPTAAAAMEANKKRKR